MTGACTKYMNRRGGPAAGVGGGRSMMITRREFNLLTGAVLAAPSMLIEACGGASQPTSSANLIKRTPRRRTCR
jgi:hypothetical protein